MRIMKRFIYVLLCLMLLCSCNKNNEETDIDDISLSKIYLSGTLKIGVNGPRAPLFFTEKAEYTGFDVDVLNEVCAILDVVPEYIMIDWDKKYELLQSGKIDMIASGFSETPERKEQYGMSLPIIKNVQCIIVRADETRFKTFDDLKGHSVCFNVGSTAESYVEQRVRDGFDVQIQRSSNVSLAFKNLKTRAVDAIITDIVVANYTISQGPQNVFKMLNTAIIPENYVYAFRKEDKALMNAVDVTLKEMAQDGVLSQITKKWFRNDVSLIR